MLRKYFSLSLKYSQASMMSSFVFAPVNTIFPELKIRAALTLPPSLQITPGNDQSLKARASAASVPISIFIPTSPLATILVTEKVSTLTFFSVALEMSFTAFSAEILASASVFAPIIMSFPDLKTRMVLFGSVFLMMTAGKRLGLYRVLSDFWAMVCRSKDLRLSRARATTFWISGNINAF